VRPEHENTFLDQTDNGRKLARGGDSRLFKYSDSVDVEAKSPQRNTKLRLTVSEFWWTNSISDPSFVVTGKRKAVTRADDDSS